MKQIRSSLTKIEQKFKDENKHQLSQKLSLIEELKNTSKKIENLRQKIPRLQSTIV